MILNQDITVVVQGPVIQHKPGMDGADTRTCLESIRHYLPGSEIILSSWKGSDTTGLDFDRLIESEDPGTMHLGDGWNQNVNRLIVSTRSALEHSHRPYTLKMRTDCRLSGVGFLELFGRHPERNPDLKVFEQRLVCTDLFFRHPRKGPHSLLFHPSDIFQFGLTNDLKKLWTIPCAERSEIHLSSAKTIPWIFREPTRSQVRYAPEQFIWISSLSNFGLNIRLGYSWQTGLKLIFRSELSIINNFIPLPPAELGVVLPKKFLENGPGGIYNYQDFLELYDLYCPHLNRTRIMLRILFLYLIARRRPLGNLRREYARRRKARKAGI